MGQFDGFIEELKKGNTVTLKPRGNSMKGRINSGDLVKVSPVNKDVELYVDDIVLVKVHGRVYLHLIKAIRKYNNSQQFQIGNNRGHINGWANKQSVYGVVVSINGTSV